MKAHSFQYCKGLVQKTVSNSQIYVHASPKKYLHVKTTQVPASIDKYLKEKTKKDHIHGFLIDITQEEGPEFNSSITKKH